VERLYFAALVLGNHHTKK